MKRTGIEGIYLGGWATSAKGSAHEDPGPDLASYPLEPGARRGGADRPRAPHRRQEPVLRALAHDRGAAQGDRRRRLPALHHRRRRHRSRRRRPRAQPRSPLRRGRRARLPHRRSEARREEVRPPGRQGPRLRRRADQAPQRRALPARHHAGARASSSPAPTPSRPRSSTAAATSAISRSFSAPRTSTVPSFKVGLPRHPAPLPQARHRGAQRLPALRDRARTSTPPPTPGSTQTRPRRRSSTRPSPIYEKAGSVGVDAALDKVFDQLRRRLAGRGQREDVRRGRRRGDALPRERGRRSSR